MNMINVTVGNNVKRERKNYASDTTIRNILEDNGIDYTVGMVNIDGATLQAGDMDKTLDDFGITERTYILQVVKADNA